MCVCDTLEKERKRFDSKIAIARSCRFASLMIGLIFYWIFIVRNVPIDEEEEEKFLNSNLIV